MPENIDTIAAIATPPGRGGIGVIRVSGKRCKEIFKALTGHFPKPRLAQYVSFKSSLNKTIDKGIALYFEAPSSYTGEDVMECHAHGSRIVLGMLLDEIISLGARTALPGEFTERAFLNNKIDLVQAEAITDLIDSNSKKAARCAMQSLEGVFSNNIMQLRDYIFDARTLLEAALDFPDEDDVLVNIEPAFENIRVSLAMLDELLHKAEAGRVLGQNPSVVIVGSPNVGKSCIINYLSGIDSAIVSTLPGTTRDIIREKVLLGDYAITLVDTAGIRETNDEIEKEGVERAFKALAHADLVLYVLDHSLEQIIEQDVLDNYLSPGARVIIVRNKIDLCNKCTYENTDNDVYVSAITGTGMDTLVDKICLNLDISGNEEDLIFARQRHIDALNLVRSHLQRVLSDVDKSVGLEVLAESLRLSLSGFDEITGKTTTDDILGNVFSRFCIGK
ncbi:MAG: tRNA uridine-5-carboxymethylaminomethyl(34) synthesis GTPase MnmE [Proteobacteria bacterium]|nr:tRNA uridine-5-carboxymethylaminomethyl(34) synthesis GTPase MnmE [Pseudomonadota bacterium]